MLESGRLFLDVSPSRYLTLMLLSVYVLTLVSIVMIYRPDVLYITLMLLVIVSAGFVHALGKMAGLKQVSISATDKCSIVIADGKTYDASLLRGCYCSDWLIILVFNAPEISKTFYTILLNDSANMSQLKKLRVLLKTSVLHTTEPQ